MYKFAKEEIESNLNIKDIISNDNLQDKIKFVDICLKYDNNESIKYFFNTINDHMNKHYHETWFYYFNNIKINEYNFINFFCDNKAIFLYKDYYIHNIYNTRDTNLNSCDSFLQVLILLICLIL